MDSVERQAVDRLREPVGVGVEGGNSGIQIDVDSDPLFLRIETRERGGAVHDLGEIGFDALDRLGYRNVWILTDGLRGFFLTYL